MAESFVSNVELEATLQKLETESKAKSSDESFEMVTAFANETTKQLFNGEEQIWSGTVMSPSPIAPTFTHIYMGNKGTLPAGIKFGRVYVDSEDQLPTTRKFIIAFDSPAGKVYAESGPVGHVDWNVVEDRLGKGERTTVVVDDILGGKIVAGVYENGNAYARFMDN